MRWPTKMHLLRILRRGLPCIRSLRRRKSTHPRNAVSAAEISSCWSPRWCSSSEACCCGVTSAAIALHVVELWKYPFADYAAHEADYAKFSSAINEGGEVKLQRFAKEYSAGGPQPELVTHQGNAANCILSFAEKENMDVIVMGTHGRRGFDRLVLGSTTDRVMRKAACPVLVVSNPAQKSLTTGPDGGHRLSRIVYCTDFSNNSERARGYAISLTAEYNAELICCTWPRTPPICRGRRLWLPSPHENSINSFQRPNART